MTLDQLLTRWGLPPQFAQELRFVLSAHDLPTTDKHDTRSEAFVASQCRVVGGQIGLITYRNNVGVLEDVNGRPVRYGLANETPAMNKSVKSGDDIGVYPYVVQPKDIGRTLGVFVSIEHKKPSWSYKGDGREPAQLAWQNVINGCGGVAFFATRGNDVIDRLVSHGLLLPERLNGAIR